MVLSRQGDHLCRGLLGTLPTRHTGAKGNKGDSVDRILKVNEATQVAGNIANDSSADTNHADGDKEAGIAYSNSCRGCTE